VSAGVQIERAETEILCNVSTPSDEEPESPDLAGIPTTTNATDPAPRPTRRVFSPEYKLAMVAEYGERPPTVRKVQFYAERASTPPISSNGHELVTRGP